MKTVCQWGLMPRLTAGRRKAAKGLRPLPHSKQLSPEQDSRTKDHSSSLGSEICGLGWCQEQFHRSPHIRPCRSLGSKAQKGLSGATTDLMSPLCPLRALPTSALSGADSRISATLPQLSCPSQQDVLPAGQGEPVVSELKAALARSWV